MKDAKITFRLAEEDKARIEAVAEKQDIPAAQLIRYFIKQGLREMARHE